ncbi:MAG TPA: YicC/YloC family endoribonuclease [Thermaerobacter sp.]
MGVVRSMTGFGRGSAQSETHRFTVEIRSLNHRFLDISVRLPREYSAFEDRIRRAVAQAIERGRIDLAVRVDRLTSTVKAVHVDTRLAHAYHEALKELRKSLRLHGTIDLELLIGFPDVLRVEQADEDLEALWPVFEQALSGALAELVAMREAEGEALARDLERRAAAVEDRVAAIEARAPEVVREYHRRLTSRLEEWGLGGIDPERVAAEVALMAERSDVSEECVRLRSHCRQFREALRATGAVGRRLEFLVQEMHREVTTIGSKAGDVTISSLVVDIKAELEKMREQVQNIE